MYAMLALFAAITLGQPAVGDAASELRSPWQRLLAEADLKRAEELQRKVDDLIEAGKFAEAIAPAAELAALRESRQGKDHWQSQDARLVAKDVAAWSRLPAEDRASLHDIREADRQADSLDEAGNYADAFPLRTRVLALRRKVLGDEHPDTAASYISVAANLGHQGKYAEATEPYRKALDIFRAALGEEHPDTAKGYDNLGSNQNSLAKYSAAGEALMKALVIRQRVLGEEHAETAKSLNNLASNLFFQGKHAQAAEFFDRALATQRKLRGEEDAEIANMYGNVAYNLTALGKYPQAADSFQKSLDIHRKVLGEEHRDTIGSYANLGYIQSTQGKYAEAAETYRHVLAVRRRTLGDEHPDTAISFISLGYALNELGKQVEAEQWLRQAAETCARVFGEDHPRTADAYNNLSGNLRDQGKYAAAAEGFQKALAIRRKALGEEHAFTADSYNNVGLNLYSQRKFAEAAEFFQKALTIHRQALGADHPEMARDWDHLAAALYQRGKRAEAMELFQKALEIRRKAWGEEHPRLAGSYEKMANFLQTQSKYAEAAELAERALALRRRLPGENHPDTARNYQQIASILQAQGDLTAAQERFEKALAIRREVLGDEHPDTAASCYHLAVNLHAQGKHQQAQPLYATASAIADKNRLHLSGRGVDRSLADSKSTRDDGYAAFLARMTKPAQAWQALENALGRGLLDDLAAKQRMIPPELRRERAELMGQIASLERLLELRRPKTDPDSIKLVDAFTQRQIEHKAALANLEQQLERQFGPAVGQPFSLQAIQSSMPPDAAIIAWVDLKLPSTERARRHYESWAFLLRSNGVPLVIALRGSGTEGTWTDEDAAMPDKLLGAIRNPRMAVPPFLTTRFANNRFAPLGNHLSAGNGLPQVRHLIVVPSDFVSGLPIELLAPANVLVSYAPSGSLWAYLKQLPKSETQGWLAFGDPELAPPEPADGKQPASAESFDPLPGAAVELDLLANRFQRAAWSTRAFRGLDASEPRLAEMAANSELKKYHYLHIATHGVIDNERPSRSALIMSQVGLPDRAEQFDKGLPVYDGKVTVEEIAEQWELDADLVVLSACETALGREAGGEGFIGFAQALLTAGARSVVLSLWRVDDTATALLMDRFYGNLLGQNEGLEKPLPKAEALAEAKRWLRELPAGESTKLVANLSAGVERGKGRVARIDPNAPPPKPAAPPEGEKPYAHPYYWAAFILIGDPG